MEKELIPFDRILFKEQKVVRKRDVNISNDKKREFYASLKKKGFYDGKVKVVESFSLKKGILNLVIGEDSFFNVLLIREFAGINIPILAVNAIIKLKDSIILIKRGENVYSCKNQWDFPAGLVHSEESIAERLKNRIEEDSNIDWNHLKIKGLVRHAILTSENSFNLFFNFDYVGDLENIHNLSKEKGFYIVKKSELKRFMKKNGLPVFFEIFSYI